jgi:hypothetical protein
MLENFFSLEQMKNYSKRHGPQMTVSEWIAGE